MYFIKSASFFFERMWCESIVNLTSVVLLFKLAAFTLNLS